ncbi:MAG: dienelactone hydrolase family protein [Bacteroidetes bacterium]|nr:dienelactone hydrolase family protein [Bacteroidota bacterium]
MKKKIHQVPVLRILQILIIMLTINSTAYSKTKASAIKEETVTYKTDGITCTGFIAWDENIKGKRPVVLVVHEWWGLNDYAKMRTRKLAELGYFAMAVDMFGNGRIAADPKEAQECTRPFYNNPQLSKSRLDAAINKIKEFPLADPGNIAAIGYCFGGSVVLNSAKLGAVLKGVVSFHGGLGGAPVIKSFLKAKILVCQGGSDQSVSQHDVDAFRHQMDSIGADYTFKVYPNATHAFSNPDATMLGKKFNLPIEYNATADHDSWKDMEEFLKRLFRK